LSYQAHTAELPLKSY